MDHLQCLKLRVKLRRNGYVTTYHLEADTPKGWCELKRFACHEAARTYLSDRKLKADNIEIISS